MSRSGQIKINVFVFQSKEHGEGLIQSGSRPCGTGGGNDKCVFYTTKKTFDRLLTHNSEKFQNDCTYGRSHI